MTRRIISVVVPVRNEEASIERALAPLLADPVDTDLEIIVADGRSTDRTRDVVERLAARDSRVRLVDNPLRVTPAGLNIAIRASRGDVIARMDGHAVPEDGYLAACLRILAESGAWNVGGRITKVGTTAAARAAAAATTSPFGIGGGVRFHLQREAANVDSLWPGFWPRWVFDRIGLFDPEMTQNQDEELNQRILDAGGAIRFDPAIGATYLSRATWRGLFRQYFRYGMFKVRAIQKRPSLLRLRHLVPAGLVAVLVGGLFGGLLAPAAFLLPAVVSSLWLATAVWFARRVAPQFNTTVPAVVAAFACLHLGYGFGMWTGLVRFAHRWLVNRKGTIPSLSIAVG